MEPLRPRIFEAAIDRLQVSERWRVAAARPVSSASSAFFRIAFGLAMVVNVSLYLPYLVREYYVATTVHFSYPGLDFIQPLPGPGIYVVYVAKGILGILIALGLWYRAAVATFFVLHTYVFLLDSTFFQNHEYLISLMSFLMIFMPLERRWSLDARRRPGKSSRTVPAWVVWLIRFQAGIVYFYGGVAKLNADWFQGEPLRMWLHRRTDIEIIGPLFEFEAVVWFMNYGSLVFDLVVVGFLLYPRTRLAAFVVATCFHLINVRLFGLFIFPWLMIAATTIYFRPDWPERVLAWMRDRRRGPAGLVGGSRRALNDDGSAAHGALTSAESVRPIPAALAGFLVVWAALQVLVPLRHYLIPGSPNWTEEGHRFAWHMKLRDKQGTGTFHVTANGLTFEASPSDHLSREQEFRMWGHPERLARFAHYLSDLHDGAEVRVETAVSLNGREPVPLVDPAVDLSQVPLVWWGPADWILPLDEPLRRN